VELIQLAGNRVQQWAVNEYDKLSDGELHD
jgi:hypothetical protein